MDERYHTIKGLFHEKFVMKQVLGQIACCGLWQYRLWNFMFGDTKHGLPKTQKTFAYRVASIVAHHDELLTQ